MSIEALETVCLMALPIVMIGSLVLGVLVLTGGRINKSGRL